MRVCWLPPVLQPCGQGVKHVSSVSSLALSLIVLALARVVSFDRNYLQKEVV